MIFIEHRRNQSSDLFNVPTSHGVEIDLRTRSEDIILAHDPFQQGERFQDWLEVFSQKKFQGPLILNTKEDGLEPTIMKMLNQASISNFLFLDTAFPTFIKHSALSPEKFMLRISAHEPWESVAAFAGRVKWLWVDCFQGVPVDALLVERASKEFQLCLVSPELQNAPLKEKGPLFAPLLSYFSAICTKHPEIWKSL